MRFNPLMSGHIAGIFRHPVKGFTPEPLQAVQLAPGVGFPFDRVWAVENGPSGFDPAAPAWITKSKFTVLAQIPKVAAARTRLDEAAGVLHVAAPEAGEISVRLSEPDDRAAFEAWLTRLLGDEVRGALKVLESPPRHRFTDHPQGQVSIINLESVRDLSRRMGAELDPLRFRANLYVDGWPAWAENGWVDKALMIGWARAQVFKPIVRCVATHVNPTTAACDQEVTKALFDNFGNMHCGVYVHITSGGVVGLGDAATTPETQAVPATP
jgi:hypothetical protein